MVWYQSAVLPSNAPPSAAPVDKAEPIVSKPAHKANPQEDLDLTGTSSSSSSSSHSSNSSGEEHHVIEEVALEDTSAETSTATSATLPIATEDAMCAEHIEMIEYDVETGNAISDDDIPRRREIFRDEEADEGGPPASPGGSARRLWTPRGRRSASPEQRSRRPTMRRPFFSRSPSPRNTSRSPQHVNTTTFTRGRHHNVDVEAAQETFRDEEPPCSPSGRPPRASSNHHLSIRRWAQRGRRETPSPEQRLRRSIFSRSPVSRGLFSRTQQQQQQPEEEDEESPQQQQQTTTTDEQETSHHSRPFPHHQPQGWLELHTSDSSDQEGNTALRPGAASAAVSMDLGRQEVPPVSHESDDESDGGWSDTDDDSLEGDDPLDILEKRHEGDEEDDDDRMEEASIHSSQSWSPSIASSQRLRNPYRHQYSSSASVSDFQQLWQNNRGDNDEEETLADSPSVQAIWNDEESAVHSKSSLQLRGYAEQAVLRQELSELVAQPDEGGLEFWVVTTGHEAGDSDSDEDEEVSVVTDGGGFYHQEGIVTVAETATTAGLSDEDSEIDSDSSDDGDQQQRHYHPRYYPRGGVPDQEMEEVSMASTNAYREVDPMIMEVDPAHHPTHDNHQRRSPTPPRSASRSVSWAARLESTTVVPRDDDENSFFDVEQAYFDQFKKLATQRAQRKHKIIAAALFLLGCFLLFFLRRRFKRQESNRTGGPVFSHIYLASPTTPFTIPNATFELPQEGVAYHASSGDRLRVSMRAPIVANTETRIVGVADQIVGLAGPCPTDMGTVLYRNAPERSGMVTMDVVMDGGVDASLVLCQEDIIVAAKYVILNQPNIVDKSNYTAVMDLSEARRVETLVVGPGTTHTGPGTIMLVPSDASVDFFTFPLPLRVGHECDEESLPEATWLPNDVSTMLPSIAWWRIPSLKPDGTDSYIHTCRDGVVQSRGVVQYQVIDTDSPTSTPTASPTTDDIALPTATPSSAPTPQPTLATLSGTWETIGEEITGPGFGTAVALSRNGRVIAVGSPVADDLGLNNVFIYELNSGKWDQLGPKLYGKDEGNAFGHAVALSEDGMIVVIGAHRNDGGEGQASVYQNINGRWDQMGVTIHGDDPEGSLGVAVDISPDGGTIAVGSHSLSTPGLRNVGQIQVFKWDEDAGEWIKYGPPIYGLYDMDNFGYYVSLAVQEDGTTIVAGGARGYDGQDNTAGHARVYRYGGDDWNLMGQVLEPASYVAGATPVSLSDDGQRIVTGSTWAAENAGQVSVYEYDAEEDMWELLGRPMRGSVPDDWLGLSVDISGDGNTVAAGAVFSDSGGDEKAGEVRVYRYDSEEGEWIIMGTSLKGEDPYDHFGRSVSLSRNGDRIAAGAFWIQPERPNGTEGRVRVKDFNVEGQI